MRIALQALTSELKRLKVQGVTAVPVSAEALEALRGVVARRQEAQGSGDALSSPPSRESASPASSVPRQAVPEAPPKPSEKALPPPPVVTLPEGDKATRWEALRQQVLADDVCREHVRPGKKVVFGVGQVEARIFFCGEAPGAEEEMAGEPFVGPAGQLLTRMIGAMGLARPDVYIGNIMNWRPQMPLEANGEQYGNRPPTEAEMAYCLPYLRAQIEVVDPEVIVALGATAAQGLLGVGSFKTLGEIRGRWKLFAGKPVMVTYHPSYILRNNSLRSKRASWEDLLQVMERVSLPISDKQRRYFLDK